MNHYTYFLRAEDISLWRAILQYARRMLHARARYHQCLEYLHGCILEPLASQTCMPEFHLLQEVLPSLSAGAAEKIAKNLWNALADDGCRFNGQLESPLHHGCMLPAIQLPDVTVYQKKPALPAENRLTERRRLQKYKH